MRGDAPPFDSAVARVLRAHVRAESFAARTDVHMPWHLAFPPAGRARVGFHAVLDGRATLRTGSGVRAVLGPGDLVVLPRGSGHSLDDGDGEVHAARTFSELVTHPSTRTARGLVVGAGSGHLTSLVCGVTPLAAPSAVLHRLPEVLVVESERVGGEPSLGGAIRALALELERHGNGAVASSLVQAVLLGALRLAATSAPASRWALDDGIARVVDEVSSHPERPWTVTELARVARMSVTTFKRRFKDELGRTPAELVIERRMSVAEGLLAEGHTVGRVSQEVGYRSEFAFARAFKRETGSPPGRARTTRAPSGSRRRTA